MQPSYSEPAPPRRLKSRLAGWGLDVPRYLARLWGGGEAYLGICNRGERLRGSSEGPGFECAWKYTSELRAPLLFPWLGSALMRRALRAHPTASRKSAAEGAAEVSFIIGHRGEARLPLLLRTLDSIAAQEGARVECIVVEQDVEQRVRARLPSWVRYLHTPPPDPSMPYCRAWSFNLGAAQARSELLVLHDNDMLVPVDYAHTVKALAARGYEAMNLKRFIFYLDATHTQRLLDGVAGLFERAPESIVQNLEGGGSVAISREAYRRIGGLDESFIGWGGEDNEFWQRVQTLRLWPFASLPIVHLWHAAQPGKQERDNPTLRHFEALSRIPPAERIRKLLAVDSGRSEGPHGWAPVPRT